jgi:hypothetical protein
MDGRLVALDGDDLYSRGKQYIVLAQNETIRKLVRDCRRLDVG